MKRLNEALQSIVTDDDGDGYIAAEAMDDIRELQALFPALFEALVGLADCAGITSLPGYRRELDDAMRKARAVIARVERNGARPITTSLETVE